MERKIRKMVWKSYLKECLVSYTDNNETYLSRIPWRTFLLYKFFVNNGTMQFVPPWKVRIDIK